GGRVPKAKTLVKQRQVNPGISTLASVKREIIGGQNRLITYCDFRQKRVNRGNRRNHAATVLNHLVITGITAGKRGFRENVVSVSENMKKRVSFAVAIDLANHETAFIRDIALFIANHNPKVGNLAVLGRFSVNDQKILFA